MVAKAPPRKVRPNTPPTLPSFIRHLGGTLYEQLQGDPRCPWMSRIVDTAAPWVNGDQLLVVTSEERVVIARAFRTGKGWVTLIFDPKPNTIALPEPWTCNLAWFPLAGPIIEERRRIQHGRPRDAAAIARGEQPEEMTQTEYFERAGALARFQDSQKPPPPK
jgi:hypothetical protein